MRAAIALGSNLPSAFGDPAANLREALRRLQDAGKLLAVSSFRETEPVGFTEQPRFLNAAALLDTPLGPLPLLRTLLEVERGMGRDRSVDAPPKGPRIIDLDLLLYEDVEGTSLVLQDADLTLPHPELPRRSFVLEPLAEIAPGMRVPPAHRSVVSLWEGLAAASVRKKERPAP